MTVNYGFTSPYYTTPQTSWYLDHWTPRIIKKSPDDDLYRIPNEYNFRPDRLAEKLYGNSTLWWIFAVLNTDIIKDPIWDFKTGLIIAVPTTRRVELLLGGN